MKCCDGINTSTICPTSYNACGGADEDVGASSPTTDDATGSSETFSMPASRYRWRQRCHCKCCVVTPTDGFWRIVMLVASRAYNVGGASSALDFRLPATKRSANNPDQRNARFVLNPAPSFAVGTVPRPYPPFHRVSFRPRHATECPM